MTQARILVVEDERLVARDLQQQIEALGYSVPALAASGAEALARVAETQPDLIMMDIHLKGATDGITAAEQIRTHFRVPVIHLTAYADPPTLERAKQTEPFGYLLKPFAPRDLQATIEMALYKHRMEQALRRSEQELRTVLETAGDAIITLDPHGALIRVNAATTQILGYPREDLLDAPFEVFLTEDSRSVVRQCLEQVRQGKGIPPLFEVVVVRKDGTMVPLEAQVRGLYDGEALVALICVLRDISLKKAFEQQRSDFLAMLTHDIKNPLGVILGYSGILREELGPHGVPEVGALLAKIENSTLTVHSLVTNYLELSRLESGQVTLAKTPFAINDLLRRMEQQYDLEAQRRSQTLGPRVAEGLPLIAGDILALERVFANLLYNALKFTPAGGNVTISSAPETGGIRIDVSDTGPGIDPEEVPFLFDKYRRSVHTTTHPGTGLGLFIVKALAEAHGGRVAVTSTVGAGSCFSVFLPTSLVSA